jgi:hypothetical protein
MFPVLHLAYLTTMEKNTNNQKSLNHQKTKKKENSTFQPMVD